MKNIPEHIILDLIPSVLSGEASAEEIKKIDAWLAENDENKKFFEEIKQTWVVAGEATTLDADASWEQLKEKIAPVKAAQPVSSWRYWAAAASVVLLITLGLLFMNGQQESLISKVTEGKETLQLADGSVVYLNARSSFGYPAKFTSSTREVELREGEAFFEVQKNPEMPFVVHAGGVEVKVLGTSFNTKVTEDSVEVIVNTGKVSVTGAKGTATLLPGQRAVYYLNENRIASGENGDGNFLAWKNGLLEFNNTPLKDVLQKIEQLYDVDIEYKADDVIGKHLTGRYKTNDLMQLLQVVAMSADVKLDTVNKKYIIRTDEEVMN